MVALTNPNWAKKRIDWKALSRAGYYPHWPFRLVYEDEEDIKRFGFPELPDTQFGDPYDAVQAAQEWVDEESTGSILVLNRLERAIFYVLGK